MQAGAIVVDAWLGEKDVRKGRCRWNEEAATGMFLIRLESIGYRSRDKDGEVSERKVRTEVSGVKMGYGAGGSFEVGPWQYGVETSVERR
jgi:hypothetical protein